jgi:hypothetical protein
MKEDKEKTIPKISKKRKERKKKKTKSLELCGPCFFWTELSTPSHQRVGTWPTHGQSIPLPCMQ